MALKGSFKKGDPRINRKGAAKREWTWSGLLAQVAEEYAKDGKTPAKMIIARRLFAKAAEGDVYAIKELMNRMDGFPKQPVVGDKDEPLTINWVSFQDKQEENE